METTFTLFDLAFIFALIIFIALAFFRGFVREIFSLINWIISIFATIFLSDYVAMGLKTFVSNAFVVNISSIIICFMIVFIGSTILTRKFGTALKEKIPYTTDQVLGVAYAFLKTFLIFGLIYSFTVNGHGIIFNKSSSNAKYKDSMPGWLYSSKFRSVISPFGNALDPVTKMILKKISPKFNFKEKKEKKDSGIFDIFKSKPGKKGKKVEKLEPYTAFGKKVKKDAEKIENRGYNKKQIEKMDRLIEIIE